MQYESYATKKPLPAGEDGKGFAVRLRRRREDASENIRRTAYGSGGREFANPEILGLACLSCDLRKTAVALGAPGLTLARSIGGVLGKTRGLLRRLLPSATLAGSLKEASAGPEVGEKAIVVSATAATIENIAIGCSAERWRRDKRGMKRLRSRGSKRRSNSGLLKAAVIVVGPLFRFSFPDDAKVTRDCF